MNASARYTLPQIIDRMNWIGVQAPETRDRLRADCTARGHHLATGERFLTAHPIDTCFHCGSEFYEDER